MRRLVWALWMAAVVQSASAQPGGFGVAVGPMPNYFSGTNCRAYGRAQIGEPIVDAELYLNNELVHEYHHSGDPLEPYPLSMGLAVMFDSSHWPNGTMVEVVYRVRGLYSYVWQYAYGYAPTWNQAMLYSHDDLPTCVPVVHSLLSGRNYDFSAIINGGQWPPAHYLEDMGVSNVMFCATHGCPTSHQAGNGAIITPADYEQWRIEQVGTGMPPPFNNGSPSVNFIHLYSCNTGDTNDFLAACWPYYMGWGGVWLENQALFTYSVYVPAGGTWAADHVNAIWSRMVEGKSAGFVQLEILTALENEELILWVRDAPGLKHRVMAPGDLTLYDSIFEHGATRIKSVYTGTNVLPIGWKRTL